LIAFVDESVLDYGPTSIGVYVIGCVRAKDDCDALRTELAGHGRFHFYRVGETRRAGMARKIRKSQVETSAYVFRGLYGTGQEEARRRCLRSMLRDLRKWQVEQLVVESRGQVRDTRDRVTIMSAVNSSTAPKDLKYSWADGAADPMLWMADAIAGMVRTNVGTGRYQEDLSALATDLRQVL
jgi:hypothetical protein